MFNKIKAVKDLRTQAKKMQNELDLITAEGTGAWGKVKVRVNGNQKILGVEIDDELVGNKEKLQEAVKEATNDALKKIQKDMAGKMKEMGGLQDLMKNLGM
ncbi:YbaB/EbfC family nucleoid-associated protein [Patescibacteria group bacterium]|nr:YbaB/EbfC family nucleoid-associated protein [Patescibacteria group bacterium]MBU1705916.1 YbaB/EbfC family nucleoid-associated protein [Patescibacteria group bacterium]